jgi:hypothetical protein
MLPAKERATVSDLPPGAKGTTKRMGLLGHAACVIESADDRASADAAMMANSWRRVNGGALFGGDAAFLDDAAPLVDLLLDEFFSVIGRTLLNVATQLCHTGFDFG